MTTPSINLFKRIEIVISPSMHPYIHPSIHPYVHLHVSIHFCLPIYLCICSFVKTLASTEAIQLPFLAQSIFIHSIIHPPIHPSILPLIQHKGKNSNCRAVFFLALPAPCLAVYSVFHYALTFHFIIQSLLAP